MYISIWKKCLLNDAEAPRGLYWAYIRSANYKRVDARDSSHIRFDILDGAGQEVGKFGRVFFYICYTYTGKRAINLNCDWGVQVNSNIDTLAGVADIDPAAAIHQTRESARKLLLAYVEEMPVMHINVGRMRIYQLNTQAANKGRHTTQLPKRLQACARSGHYFINVDEIVSWFAW